MTRARPAAAALGEGLDAHGMIEATGPWCAIQDLGRRGGRREGLAPGGAMDQRAFLWANRLLDNDPAAPALEIALGGLALRFAVDSVVALAGADCGAELDAAKIGGWRTVGARAGQVLRLGYSATGMRAYLAFPGGLLVDRAFGSASTVVRDGLPGRLGRSLRAGETLSWGEPGRRMRARRVPEHLVPLATETIKLPLVPGYEWQAFSATDRELAFAGEWRVDPASNRTAVRLVGPPLPSGPRVLDSTPLVDGTVQVTGDGQPLVFMRDRPTIGGYAKLGAVDPIVLDALAQARPGARVRFVRADPAEMRRALVRRERFFGLARS